MAQLLQGVKSCWCTCHFFLLQFIMKCAMSRLPNQPYLLTLYSNFIIEVRDTHTRCKHS